MVNQLTPLTQITLNLLRALAAQFVLFGHAMSFLNLGCNKAPCIQNIAVMIFFILSGFLISFSLIRKNFQTTFKEFFLARFCRIYSGLIPAILFITFMDFLALKLNSYSHFSDFSIKTFLGNIFMLQNFPLCHMSVFGSARPFWTLNIEWWMYMFWGWFALKFLFNKKLSKLWFVHLLILLFFLLMPLRNKYDLSILWMLGVLASFLLVYKDLLKNKNILLITSIIIFCFLVSHSIKHKVDYCLKNHVLLFESFLLLVLYTENCNKNIPEKLSKWIQFWADYSFTLYLIHYSICELLSKYTNNLFFLILISNIISIGLAEFTEKKHKYLYKILLSKKNDSIL